MGNEIFAFFQQLRYRLLGRVSQAWQFARSPTIASVPGETFATRSTSYVLSSSIDVPLQTITLGGVLTDVSALWIDGDDRVFHAIDLFGRHWVDGGNGDLVRITDAAQSNAASLDAPLQTVLLGGSRVDLAYALTDNDDNLIFGVTLDGEAWAAQRGGVVRIGGPAEPPPLRYNSDITYSGLIQNGGVGGIGVQVMDDPTAIAMIIGLGQSWDNGGGSGASFTPMPLDPGKSLMFDAGAYPDGAPVTAFVDLHEGPPSALPSIETSGSRLCHAIQLACTTANVPNPTLLWAVSAAGGKSLKGIQRGSPIYAEALRLVHAAVRIAAPLGRRIVVVGVATLHGQQNAGDGTTRDEYTRGWARLRRDLEADVKAITGRSQTLHVLTHQVVDGQEYPHVALSQRDLMDRLPDDFTVSGPSYWAGPNDSGSPAHLSAMALAQLGEMQGRAAAAQIFGSGHLPQHVQPGRVKWVNATTFQLEYERPVTVDDTNAIVDVTTLKSFGFSFDDGSEAPPAILTVTNVPSPLPATVSDGVIQFGGVSGGVSSDWNLHWFGCASRTAVVITHDGATYQYLADRFHTLGVIATALASLIPGAVACGAAIKMPSSSQFAVAVFGASLEIVLSAPPNGPRRLLRYANGATGNGIGNQVGARGCVRSALFYAVSAVARGGLAVVGDPRPGDTITVNGVTLKFTASEPAPGEIVIGERTSTTAARLQAYLAAQRDEPRLAIADFSLGADRTTVIVHVAVDANLRLTSATQSIIARSPTAIPLYDWALVEEIALG